MRYIKEKGLYTIILLYMLIGSFIEIYDPSSYIKIINPLFMGFIIILLLFVFKNENNYRNTSFYESKLLLFIIIYLLIYFGLGFVIGFGKNPYSITVNGILKNVIQILLPIVGIELLRGKIIYPNKKNKLAFSFITITFILIEINFSTIINMFNNSEMLFKYICSVIIPLISYNFLFSYFSSKSSYRLALIFRLITETIVFTLPVIPNMDWFVTGCFGTLFSFFMFIVFKMKIFKDNSDIKLSRRGTKTSKTIYYITLISCALLVSFMLGLFKYEPIAILSNSMYPKYSRGDVLIYEKKTEEELQNLQINSIIIYKVGNQNVAHRIIEKNDIDGVITYRTKGDNNNAPDLRDVNIDQIVGVYVGHIKYIGFPSVWLNDYFNHGSAVVETK